ncbi:ester cyclase [Arthrobacter sp. NyZ413]|uniref:ester cyclase n=1 Tax=Arthrobacter sp. NyZ413 TaxID=3144669 RepID=UPI003BF8933B
MQTDIRSIAPSKGAAEIVRQVLVNAWNTGDVRLLDEHLATDYVRHGRTEESDKEHIKSTIEMARAAFPDLNTEVVHQVVDGEMVATHWRCVGTHEGPFYDLPITHQQVVIRGMTFSRLSGDKVAEEWESWSGTDLFASLGVANLWEA